nr:hypothetical protein [Desulforamulus aquiferis]
MALNIQSSNKEIIEEFLLEKVLGAVTVRLNNTNLLSRFFSQSYQSQLKTLNIKMYGSGLKNIKKVKVKEPLGANSQILIVFYILLKQWVYQ